MLTKKQKLVLKKSLLKHELQKDGFEFCKGCGGFKFYVRFSQAWIKSVDGKPSMLDCFVDWTCIECGAGRRFIGYNDFIGDRRKN